MSEMIEVKTADLAGPALNWAVATALNLDVFVFDQATPYVYITQPECVGRSYSPSTQWDQGGPLIEKYKVSLSPPNSTVHRNFGYMDKRNGYYEAGFWGSTIFGKERKHRRTAFHHPDSPLIVGMQAIVQFELGDTVQVPKDLMP